MKLSLLAFLLFPVIVFSQIDSLHLHFDSTTQKITFSEIVKVDSATADALVSRAKVAITSLFNSGKDVTQDADENAKQIIGKGFIEPYISNGLIKVVAGKVWFTITIQCKDNRYKYSISNFEHEGNSGTTWPGSNGPLETRNKRAFTQNQFQRLTDYVYNDIETFILKLKKEMSNPGNSNSNNW